MVAIGVPGLTSCHTSTSTSLIIPAIGALTRYLFWLKSNSLKAIFADSSWFWIDWRLRSLVFCTKLVAIVAPSTVS